LPQQRHTPHSPLPRLAAHSVVVGTIAVIALSSAVGLGLNPGPQFVPTVLAGDADPSGPSAAPRLLGDEAATMAEDRSRLSGRSRPPTARSAPLPTPVPVDPAATPLPAPPTPPFAESGARLAFPVPGGSVSQSFRAGHEGIDIAASPGSAVVAADAGLVTWAGWRNNGGGLVVEIDHGNGLTTTYNHLGSVWVAAGQYVGREGAIGGMGCSGVCFGPHVQFDVRINGRLTDPSGIL
jgi:murein DD-endopeptidase MepM/ murein hydrolase activator NlpD